MKDALENEIIIGNNYGYSNEYSGTTHVTIGKVLNFTKKNLVTLEVIKSYSKSQEYNNQGNKVSIKPEKLFPVNLNE